MTFQTRVRGEHVTTVESNDEGVFDSGLPRSGGPRARALYKSIRAQEFQKGDKILLTTNIHGVLASAVVIFESLGTTSYVLNVKTLSKKPMSISLQSSKKKLGADIENVCLYRAHDKQMSVDQMIAHVASRYGGPRKHKADEEDDSKDAVVDENDEDRRQPRPMVPLNPVTFLLGESAEGGGVLDAVVYEKGTPLFFMMARFKKMSGKSAVTRYEVRGNLISINKDGITLENVDPTLWDLGAVHDEKRGRCTFKWMEGDERFGFLAITSDRTTIGGTFEMAFKDTPHDTAHELSKKTKQFKLSLA